MSCYSCDNSDTNTPNFVLASKHWNVYLNSEQAYLGRMVVVNKRHVSSLGDLSLDEQVDFFKIVKILEGAVSSAFGAKLVNWTCLMNDTFQEAIPQPHVHWHFRPRYDHPVVVHGHKFEDPEFGHHYSRKRKGKVNDETIKIIVQKIKEVL